MTSKDKKAESTEKVEQRGEPDSSGVEIIRESKESTVDTNAGPDAVSGTIADHDVQGTAPASHADEDPSQTGKK